MITEINQQIKRKSIEANESEKNSELVLTATSGHRELEENMKNKVVLQELAKKLLSKKSWILSD